MQKILSNDLWSEVRRQARRARQRKAAIAYVTRDLIGFRKGDVLVVDASAQAIAGGETSARLLRTLRRKGVRLYSCADLHAKVLWFGDVAVISSGNMSNSSADGLVEAAVLTEQASTVSGVASFIEQLVRQSEELDRANIARLCRIKVVRRGGRGRERRPQQGKTRLAALGYSTWLVGVTELVRDPPPAEQKMIAKAERALRGRRRSTEEEFGWIRWSGDDGLVRRSQEGDSLIQIWRSSHAKRPSCVLRAVPILLKQRTKHWTRFYMGSATGSHAEMPWGQFQRLAKRLGYPRRLGPSVQHLLDNEIADAIARNWTSSFRNDRRRRVDARRKTK